MIKKLVVFLIAMVLLFGCAEATSILPTVPVEEVETVISFGATVGVEPVSVDTALPGYIWEKYEEVTEEQYTAFGVRLGEEGYSLLAQESTGTGGMVLTVGKGDIVLKIEYSPKLGELSVIYPDYISVEKTVPDVFEGYTVVSYGEKINIPGYGSFTLKKLARNIETELRYFAGFGIYSPYFMPMDTYLLGTFENKENRDIYYNDIAFFTLYYITEDNVYTYPAWFTSMFDEDGYIYIGSAIKSGGINFHIDPDWPFERYDQPVIRSLNSGTFAAVFSDVPELVQTSTDGVLAVTIVAGGQHYVVLDRY
ncbi:MAG: hypothetical protein E7319_05210 [Clostridiales bacterium]|nr:hypothetical protein [Clostridiales bacterium]